MRMRNVFYIATGIVVLIVAGVAWHFWSGAKLPAGSQTAAEASTTAATARPIPAQCGQSDGAACVEYRNQKYHFSLFHSDQMTVNEYDEGGGAETITFENSTSTNSATSTDSFQIFIVPYEGTQVSEQRFEEDEPSGVRDNMQDVTVDGATGAAFNSTDPSLGDTYEVWFVYGGYLYELTTGKAFAPNMQGELQTWEFI